MKKLTKSIALVAIAAIAGYNAYQMSEINAINNDLSLANIENVAQADEVAYYEAYSGWTTTGKSYTYYDISYGSGYDNSGRKRDCEQTITHHACEGNSSNQCKIYSDITIVFYN